MRGDFYIAPDTVLAHHVLAEVPGGKVARAPEEARDIVLKTVVPVDRTGIPDALAGWTIAPLPKDFKPISAAEVKAQRGKNLTKQHVYRIRQKLKRK